MPCTPAPACRQALAEASTLWPNRSRATDGICASPQHHLQNPNSDHETGDAYDLTHDPANGVNCPDLVNLLISRNDQRVKYIIHNRKIYNRKTGFVPTPYTGKNPHKSHMHVSIYSSARNDTSPWFGGASSVPAGGPGGIQNYQQQDGSTGTADQPAPQTTGGFWDTLSVALGLGADVVLSETEAALPPELQAIIGLWRKVSSGPVWVSLAWFSAGALAVGSGVALIVKDSKAADTAVAVAKAVL